jgi:hypothetical protein
MHVHVASTTAAAAPLQNGAAAHACRRSCMAGAAPLIDSSRSSRRLWRSSPTQGAFQARSANAMHALVRGVLRLPWCTCRQAHISSLHDCVCSAPDAFQQPIQQQRTQFTALGAGAVVAGCRSRGSGSDRSAAGAVASHSRGTDRRAAA